jgi:hypothetical protein
VLDFRTLRDSAGNNFPGVDASGMGGRPDLRQLPQPRPWYLTIPQTLRQCSARAGALRKRGRSSRITAGNSAAPSPRS